MTTLIVAKSPPKATKGFSLIIDIFLLLINTHKYHLNIKYSNITIINLYQIHSTLQCHITITYTIPTYVLQNQQYKHNNSAFPIFDFV